MGDKLRASAFYIISSSFQEDAVTLLVSEVFAEFTKIYSDEAVSEPCVVTGASCFVTDRGVMCQLVKMANNSLFQPTVPREIRVQFGCGCKRAVSEEVVPMVTDPCRE